MKSIMISIKPKWCELIASGKKTVEVRKSHPKIEAPFKCYIYCTQDFADSRTRRKRSEFWIGEPLNNVSKARYIGNGKVIGEFVCDEITKFAVDEKIDNILLSNMELKSCLGHEQLEQYAEGNYYLHGWHISDVKIYDKPKELNEFYIEDKTKILKCEHRFRAGKSEFIAAQGGWKNRRRMNICMKSGKPEWCENCFTKPLTRVPQSWCYCKEAIS